MDSTDESPQVARASAKKLEPDMNQVQTVIVESVPCSPSCVLLKRNVADVKFEIASADDMEDGGNADVDTKRLADAIVANTDLISGVYE
ncbi:hypothetical protein HK102_000420, partial [Quaeritorhiza haematococci]